MRSLTDWVRSRIAAGSSSESLNRRLDELEKQLRSISRELSGLSGGKPPAIVVEQIAIEKLVIEKLEHSNNFGALGIKELTGKLNIGVNHTGPIEETALQKFFSEADEPDQVDKESSCNKPESARTQAHEGPNINIRPKPHL